MPRIAAGAASRAGRKRKQDPAIDGEKTPDGRVRRKYKPKKAAKNVRLPVAIRMKELPEPPDWIRNNQYTLECWNDISAVLIQRKQLNKDTYHSLLGLCQCYSDWHRLREFLAENGSSYTTPNPMFKKLIDKGELSPEAMLLDPRFMVTRRRPEAAEFAEVDRRFRIWLCEFGLTEYSRGRVNLGPTKNEKPVPTPETEAAEDYGL